MNANTDVIKMFLNNSSYYLYSFSCSDRIACVWISCHCSRNFFFYYCDG